MRLWLVCSIGLIAWQGCARTGLDDPIGLAPETTGAAGTDVMGGGGHVGVAGAAGAAGSAGSAGHAGAGAGGSNVVGVAGAGGGAGAAGLTGSAGVSGVAGTGAAGSGAAGTIDRGGAQPCMPGESLSCLCPTGQVGSLVCQSNGLFGDCDCGPTEFNRVRMGIVGTWVGTDRSPWYGAFQVKLVFGADGTYSGHCGPAPCSAPVFYYGVDDDSPAKTYWLTNLESDGTIIGWIEIYFGPGDVQRGSLEALTLSADGQHLHFEFWNTWAGNYGPIVFDLARAM
jgi:hypothetical protein